MSKIKYTVIELNKPNPIAVENLNRMVFKIIIEEEKQTEEKIEKTA